MKNKAEVELIVLFIIPTAVGSEVGGVERNSDRTAAPSTSTNSSPLQIYVSRTIHKLDIGIVFWFTNIESHEYWE